MGFDGFLRLIDHDNLVVRGLPAAEEARRGDNRTLREFLMGLEPEVNSSKLAEVTKKLEGLKRLNAPPVVLAHFERQIAQLKGESSSRDSILKTDTGGLVAMLISWNEPERVRSLNKTWDVLHFYGDSQRRERSDGPPRDVEVLSPLDLALYGSEPVPALADGELLVKAEGYNPPQVVRRIRTELEKIDPRDWEAVDQQLAWREITPPYGLPEGEGADLVMRLSCAEEGLELVLSAYSEAAERGFGVATQMFD